MHITIKVILVLVIGYIVDRYLVRAWTDYSKIIVRKPISVKTTLNYIGDKNFKMSSKEKGIGWSMSMWMYIKDWDYRKGLKKTIMKTDCFEISMDTDNNDLVIQVPYYAEPTVGTGDSSSKVVINAMRVELAASKKKYNESRTKLNMAKSKWLNELKSAKTSVNGVWHQAAIEDNQTNKCGPGTPNSPVKKAHQVCPSASNYCDHYTSTCSSDSKFAAISSEVDNIYNRSADGTGFQDCNNIVACGTALAILKDQTAIAVENKSDMDELEARLTNELKTVRLVESIVYKRIPLQRWLNVVITVDNRTIDLWVNNKLHESLYLPNIPIITSYNKPGKSCGGGFDGFISGLTVWDHPISKNMIYYMSNNSPVYLSIYDSTIGRFYRFIDYLLALIQQHIVKITIKIHKPKVKTNIEIASSDKTCNI